MLDHRAFLNGAEKIFAGLRRRGIADEQIADLTLLVTQRRDAIQNVESMRQRLHEASKTPQAQTGTIDSARRETLKVLKGEIKGAEQTQRDAEQALQERLLAIPNVPETSVPDGPDATHNRVERVVGEPPILAFAAQNHWDIAERLDIVDFAQAAKISGSRFAVYKGAGARLERALAHFMLDVAAENGFTEIAPPLLVRPESMVAAGQYPKFLGESFETHDGSLVLIPTSEVPLINLHRDEILDAERLPLRYTAFTPCFRREAGAAGKDTRGLIRNHQFNKVELVAFTLPEQSDAELERLTASAEDVLKRLELPYRVVTLCTGDLGFCAKKTYDLEVWLPGAGCYREISSCSNCGDFQARRGKIRYRPPAGNGKPGKPQLVHTLNGSALAAGRTFVALLENHQQADGSVRIPKALVPYLGTDSIGR